MPGTREGAAKRDPNSWAQGERCRHARLDRGQVVEILEAVEHRRRLREELQALSNQALAERYGVSRQAIENVIAGKTWRHV